jgi:enoyl-CoA hydratase/carnithine racemase
MSQFPPRPKHFLWRQEALVGVITLNRPERKNPLTFESYAELRDLFRLDGAGLLEFTRMTGDLVKAMRHCPQPIVAAVDGVCAGAGAILAMSSDFRLGTPRAKTAFLFTRVGLAGCDMGACAILPRIIGHGRAAELLFTGRSMSADEGVAWGFFNRLVPPQELLQESLQLAAQIASGPTFAHAMTKKMLHAEWNLSVDAAIDAEAEAQAVCMQTEDFRRAYRAFAAKQKPQFEGN